MSERPEWLEKLLEARRLIQEAEVELLLNPDQNVTWDVFHDTHNVTFDIQQDTDSVWRFVVKSINPTDEED